MSCILLDFKPISAEFLVMLTNVVCDSFFFFFFMFRYQIMRGICTPWLLVSLPCNTC